MTKKVLAGVLAVMMLASVAVFVGCGGRDVSEHALADTEWAWNDSPSYLYVFNADGTGVRGGGMFPQETFTWTIPNDGRVNIRLDNAAQGVIRNQQWNYTIAGNSLTLDSRQTDEVYIYTRR